MQHSIRVRQPFAQGNYSHLIFPTTNESLRAITKGLDLHGGDNVLAVCGSGDQAFAIAEYVGHVVAVDTDDNQTKFARWRQERLRDGDYEGFLIARSRFLPCNTTYFTPARLRRIANKTDNIDFRTENILETTGTYTKMYLSNLFDWYNTLGIVINPDIMWATLAPSGLLYHAGPMNVPQQLTAHKMRTAIATRYEDGWTPTVYHERRCA